ncbi:MAG: protein arginine kinase [Candidatus Caldatribacteriota bacterium]|nr:protein arginine kinase [Candidatus Caldatribacteriota bacterium]
MQNNDKETLLQNLIKSTAKWTNGQGPLSDVVVSSRIRLARNIENIPFPARACQAELKNVFELIQKVIAKNPIFNDTNLILLNNLSPLENQFLVEKNLISSYFAREKYPYRAFIYNKEETLSIMVNEEDHIRIQSLNSGLQLNKIWKFINKIDDEIEKKVTYAFNEKEGYLTSCPTNVGTGMRASVMLHLPALVIVNRVKELLKAISKIGYVVRGFYGEGSEAMGDLFQISNQVTLGISEEETIDNLEKVSRNIIDQEQKARKKLALGTKSELEDRIWRAYGLLSSARIISSMEAMELLSKLRFGVELEIISNFNLSKLNKLILLIQPAYLRMLYGEELDAFKRDLQRATLIRNEVSR